MGRFWNPDPIIEKFPYLTPFNYASNSPVTKIDLWGLQGTPYYLSSNPMDYFTKPLATFAESLGNWADNFLTVVQEAGASTDAITGNVTTTQGTIVKSETSTNFGSLIGASISCNCPVPASPLTKTKTTIATEVSTTIKTNNNKIQHKISHDSDGKSTSSSSVEKQVKKLNVKGTVSAVSNGDKQASVEVSAGSNVKPSAGVTVTTKKGIPSSVSVGVGTETKTGNKTVKYKTSVKVGN